MTVQPFPGTAFQIGYVTNDVDAAVADAKRRLGLSQFVIWDVGRAAGGPGPYGSRVGMAWWGTMMLEFIQPIGEPAPVYLDDVAPPGELSVRFNHIGFTVPDAASWEELLTSAQSAGVEVAWRGSDPERFDVAYLDLRSTLGHYCEYIHLTPVMAKMLDAVPRAPD